MAEVEAAHDSDEKSATVRPGGVRRPDIQGLRAIAVLMVVLYHARLPVPGGFVGVDVFFVISGFVITSMLHREWGKSGAINFAGFYWRRFKRLTPALALMVAVVMVLSAMLLSPFGRQQIAAKTAVGAMLLCANVVIAATTGDYFDAPAESNPLLNTWSLSVEEQFYLAFPAVIAFGWAVAAKGRRWRLAPVAIVGLAAALSFGLAMVGSAQSLTFPGSDLLLGFYSPVTRAWEFAVGALLALGLGRVQRWPSRLRLWLGSVGAVALFLSLFLISSATAFPGPWTLLPVLGTLGLIVSGCGRPTALARVLGAGALVRLGDWSYSIYLWHWPAIVLGITLWPQHQWAPVIAAAVSLVPALASYHFVEQPFRQRSADRGWSAARLVTAVVLPPLLLALAVGTTADRFWAPRLEAESAVHKGDADHRTFHLYLRDNNYPCLPDAIRENALAWDEITRCSQSKPDPGVSVALLGDSHAEALFPGLAEGLPQDNVAYYIQASLPIRSSPGMGLILDHLLSSPQITDVVISSYWVVRGVPVPQLQQTLRALVAAGKRVYVTDDVPTFPFEPFGCKYRKAPLIRGTQCSEELTQFERRYSQYLPSLRALVAGVPGAVLVNTAHHFCDSERCSMIDSQGSLLYRDPNHLNLNGSRFIAATVISSIRKGRSLDSPVAADSVGTESAAKE